MLTDEGARLTKVLICPPQQAYFEVQDLAAQNITARASRKRALAEHASLQKALANSGAEVITMPELPGHPNSVFTQDVALVTPEGFIQLRMGLPARRGEPEWMRKQLSELGMPLIGQIKPPGTVEGGDVILAGDVAFVGLSKRTNPAGIAQLEALLVPLGYTLRIVPVPALSLHIGGMMSVIGPRIVLACEGAFPANTFSGFEVLTVPQKDFISGNVITLGNNRVISAKQATTTIQVLRDAKFEVTVLELGEFIKGSGGPSCLVLALTRES